MSSEMLNDELRIFDWSVVLFDFFQEFNDLKNILYNDHGLFTDSSGNSFNWVSSMGCEEFVSTGVVSVWGKVAEVVDSSSWSFVGKGLDGLFSSAVMVVG